MYIVPNKVDLYQGDTKTLAIRIDTEEGECINAVDGILHYSENIDPVDISLGESILPVWVEAPKINTDSRTVTFAGGIPNGYCGRIDGDPRLTNVILELVVQSLGGSADDVASSTSAEVSFGKGTSVYLNDGSGTRTKLVTFNAALQLHNFPGENTVNEWNSRVDADVIAPNNFSLSLESDLSIFSGKYFVVFNTTDKQSGIDHYEIMEESIDEFRLFLWGASDADWIIARSPYKLSDQSLNSTIRVKAVDKAGNESIAVLVPTEGMRGISNRERSVIVLSALGIFILLGLILSFAIFWYRGRRDGFDVEKSESDEEDVYNFENETQSDEESEDESNQNFSQ